MPAEIPNQNAPGFRLTRPPDPPGKLRVLLTVVDGQIIIDFGRPIRWCSFPPEQALKLARDIEDAVRSARTLHLPLE